MTNVELENLVQTNLRKEYNAASSKTNAANFTAQNFSQTNLTSWYQALASRHRLIVKLERKTALGALKHWPPISPELQIPSEHLEHIRKILIRHFSYIYLD